MPDPKSVRESEFGPLGMPFNHDYLENSK